MDGVQLPQGLSHFEEAVYFLVMMGFNCLKATEQLRVDCLLFITKSPEPRKDESVSQLTSEG